MTARILAALDTAPATFLLGWGLVVGGVALRSLSWALIVAGGLLMVVVLIRGLRA